MARRVEAPEPVPDATPRRQRNDVRRRRLTDPDYYAAELRRRTRPTKRST